MRVAFCTRHGSSIHRLVWGGESKAGFYVGVLGAREDSHASYHTDGTRHVRIGSQYHNRFADTPINEFQGFKQLDHFSLSLTKTWFNSKTLYAGDEKTESVVLLDEKLLQDKDTLALNVWLTDRKSEQDLLAVTAKGLASDPRFTLVGEFVASLDNFPEHKVAFGLCSARVRDVPAQELMFQRVEA
jgi:hypothetical protein